MRSTLHNRFGRFFLLLAVIIFLPAFACGESEDGNILQNGSFELLDGDGLPENWFTDSYVQEPGYTVFSVRDTEGGRGRVAEIHNIGENDARFGQVIPVEPDTLYRLSGYILADGVEGGHGANLSIEGVYAFSRKCYDTGGEWEYIEYYGETGPDQEYLTVFARLGGYSGESTGTAAFDAITLTRVDRVPGDGIADRWYREDAGVYTDDDTDVEEKSGNPARILLILVAGLYILGISLLYHSKYITRDPEDLTGRKIPYHALTMCALILSLALRILISALVEGYMVDVNCFLSWGHTFATAGPAGFYEATNFCDYPPLYTYILGLNSVIASMLNSGDAVTRIVFRFLPNLCDLAACLILEQIMTRSKRFHPSAVMIFISVLALNPAMILNSAAWGQMDGVLCLLLMGVALCAIEGKWIAALPLYVVSVLVKPQALMLGPLGAAFIVITAVSRKEYRKSILYGTLVSLVVLAAGIVPFSLRQNWDWLINLYSRTLASYPYATLNTANLNYLMGGNWTAVEQSARWTAPATLALLCGLYAVWRARHSGGLKFRWAETVLGASFAVVFIVFGILQLSWSWIGAAAMVFAFIVVLCPAIRGCSIRLLAYLGALLYILLYVFGVKMHERYLLPALLLLASAFALLKDRRILIVFGAFTVTLLINEGIVLDNSIRLGSSMGHLNNDTVWLADLLCVINILSALYGVWLTAELVSGRRSGTVFPVKNAREGEAVHHRHHDRSLHWTAKDTILILSITAVYSIVTLFTLGSTKAPQTVWSSSSAEEQVVFDLGERHESISMLYFGQVSRHDFSVSFSDNGENWEEEIPAQMDEGQCWKWKYLTQSEENGSARTYSNSSQSHIIRRSGRFVRLTSGALGLKLCEVLFRDENDRLIPARIHSRTGESTDSMLCSDPAALLDEQDTMEKLPQWFGTAESANDAAQPSWWNSSYFDEIYHARTAYEFIQGTVPYETSHPPLGKVLMSLCVIIFGMTPFGWRFAGAFAGILMLPGMYLLGKQLTKRTWAATLCSMLMALDCLHLTQTQIATIDSFPVLFILFSYFFMLRFLQSNPIREKLSALLPNLALCGICMGLSIASKWIGIYAGIGLAVLFFWHCFRSLSADSRRHRQSEGKQFRRLLKLCVWCVLFFIVIPLLIYVISYIPYMAYDQRIKSVGDYLVRVWNSQVGMFNYHSTPGLGMDHPFYSPWWEWPIIGKPMYYASESYIPDPYPVHFSIFAFGNPVIWYGGLAALAYCCLRCLLSRRYRLEGSPDIWHRMKTDADPGWQFLFVGLLAQYLPWVLVPRGTYIYHYFASLPFLMLAVCLCANDLEKRFRHAGKWVSRVFILLSAVLFVLLFPYASGIAVPAWWLDIGRSLLRIWY